MPIDGTFPTGTTKWEKRNIALEIPVWDEELCIQCGKCVMVCPHAVIRAKVYDPPASTTRPKASRLPFPSGANSADLKYTLQVAPEDCTGCGLCVAVCPAKSKSEAKHQRHQHGATAAVAREVQPVLGLLPVDSGARRARSSLTARSRTRNCWSRCSSSPAPAQVAARRRTSSS